jgi:hypothetical protein
MTVLQVANRGYVMDLGLMTLSGDAKPMLDDPMVRAAYLGEACGTSIPDVMQRAKLSVFSGVQERPENIILEQGNEIDFLLYRWPHLWQSCPGSDRRCTPS